jgi:phage tail protein X
MSGTYTTRQGDMWDSICYKALGDERYMDALMALNLAYKDTFIFPAGVVLTLPDVETKVLDTLPPWKRVSG